MVGRANFHYFLNWNLRQPGKACVITLSALIVAACGGGGGGNGTADVVNDDGSVVTTTTGAPANFLVASVPDFYYGTRTVGTASTQQIELSNRSGDIYPIHRLELVGPDAEQFKTNFIGEITLNPTEKIAIDVTFSPITDGQKSAELHVEYDIIKQVSDEANRNEQNYYKASELEQRGDLDASAATYQTYLAGKPQTPNKLRAAIKFPVLSESERHGKGEGFDLYLSAINKRDENNHLGAIIKLNELLVTEAQSTYADDALYMRGYIQLMDTADYRGARDSMRQLREQYPDSKYYDTALYSEALANDEMGEKNDAGTLYQDLKNRHTSEGAKMLNLDLPKDNYLSRLWFDRAKQGLARTVDRTDLL